MEAVPAEVLVFLVAALAAGGLSMGGVTLVYFLDVWRTDPPRGTTGAARPDRSG